MKHNRMEKKENQWENQEMEKLKDTSRYNREKNGQQEEK